MTSNATQNPKPLTPPSRERCQAEITTTPSPFTMGGDLSPKTERCAQKPRHLLTEIEPGSDGRRGSMSLCDECLKVFKELTPGWQSRVRVEALLPPTDRIRLPEAFASLLAEAAADIGLTIAWSQPILRYDAAGLHGSDLWFCKGQSGPVYVDEDNRPMGLRAATVDMLGRLMRRAHTVIVDADAEERRSRRRDFRQKAADRAAKARVALVVLERMCRTMSDTWPETDPSAVARAITS